MFSWVKNEGLSVLLTKTSFPGLYENAGALPGGLILKDETAEESIVRNLEWKSGMTGKYHIEQLATFSAIDRDPRSRVVSVAFLGLIPFTDIPAGIASNFVLLSKAKKLAYDHDEVLKAGYERLKSKIEYSTIISKLLPAQFTLNDLQSVYEDILKTALDKRNFRKKILSQDVIVETGEKYAEGAHRPANMYRFKSPNIKFLSIV